MRVVLKDHGSELLHLGMALRNAGHEIVRERGDVLFIDWDGPRFGYRDMIDFYADQGAVILVYPHGAPYNLMYDSLFEPYDRVDGQLTLARGEIEYLRRLGIKRPARRIGWLYGDQLPFRPCKKVRRVTFAPTHPNGDMSILDFRRAKNREVFERLVAAGYDVTVRFLFNLEANGIPIVDGVRYVVGAMDLSTTEIDSADAVVAGIGTFPTIAVSRGIPTVVYDQHQAYWGTAGEEPVPLQRLGLYYDLTRYPFDVDDAPNIADVVAAAASEDGGRTVRPWRDRWIGESFDPVYGAKLIEAFVAELRATKMAAAC